MTEIHSIIKPLVERFSPACAGNDEDYLLDLGSMPLRETIPLFYAFLGIPTVVLPEQIHTLPRVQEYIWASIMQMTGQDTRPVVLAVSDSKEWIRGYDWDQGVYGKLSLQAFLQNLNKIATTHALNPQMLNILGIDFYERVYIGLADERNNGYLESEYADIENKVSDILEAGLILTHAPQQIVSRYQVMQAREIDPAGLRNRTVVEGLTNLLGFLNTANGKNRDVSVREIRFFADFRNYLRFDMSKNKWVYIGGYDIQSYNPDELAQQTTGVVDKTALCWSRVEQKNVQPELAKGTERYRKSFSLSRTPASISRCTKCPLKQLCGEYKENKGGDDKKIEVDVDSILGLLGRYLARVRGGMLQRFGQMKSDTQAYLFYSPVNLKAKYRIDYETANALPSMQGVLEVSFSMESYQRYYEQNFGQVRQDRTPKPPSQPTVATRPTIKQEPRVPADDTRQTDRPSQGIPAFLRDRGPVTTDKPPLPPGGAGSTNTRGNIAPEMKGAQAQPRFRAVTVELGRAGLKGDWMDKAATAIRSGGALQHELLRGAEVKEIKPGVYEVLATNQILNKALQEVEVQRGGEMATKIRIEVVNGMLHAKFLFPINDSGQGESKVQEPRKTRVVGDMGEEW